MYRLLIVDDEPNLVEGLTDYLSDILPPDTDILKAYSGQEARSLLMRFSIDLIVSDIQMPGMLGLELLSHIERDCPACCVIFLTGYDTFQWVQEALRHPCCVDYILKTQGDAAIGASVRKQLARIEQGRDPETLRKMVIAQYDAIRPLMIRQALADWLLGNTDAPPAEIAGEDGAAAIVCLYARRGKEDAARMFPRAIEPLLRDEFPNANIQTTPVGWKEYACLFQFPREDGAPIATLLHAKLEKIQNRLHDMGEEVNCAYHGAPLTWRAAKDALRGLHGLLEAADASGEEVLIDDNVHGAPAPKNERDILLWIKQYIQENIADPNLSLAVVAEKSYYTPSYLSRMFKRYEGVNLLHHIARIRIETACGLLAQGGKNVKEVCKAVGFESPSYFSAFFRRKMGVTPVEYIRMKARE